MVMVQISPPMNWPASCTLTVLKWALVVAVAAMTSLPEGTNGADDSVDAALGRSSCTGAMFRAAPDDEMSRWFVFGSRERVKLPAGMAATSASTAAAMPAAVVAAAGYAVPPIVIVH